MVVLFFILRKGHKPNRSHATVGPVRSRAAGRGKRGMMKSRRESRAPLGHTGHSMNVKTIAQWYGYPTVTLFVASPLSRQIKPVFFTLSFRLKKIKGNTHVNTRRQAES